MCQTSNVYITLDYILAKLFKNTCAQKKKNLSHQAWSYRPVFTAAGEAEAGRSKKFWASRGNLVRLCLKIKNRYTAVAAAQW